MGVEFFSMASIVLKSLSIFLGLFFIFVGIMKLTPYISRELHKDLRTEYVKYSKVIAPLGRLFNVKIASKWFRRSVGGLEILCGIALTFIPHKRTKQVANFLLLSLMITCRLVVEWQIQRQIAKDAKDAKITNGNAS